MTATTLSPLLAVLQMKRMKKLRLAYRERTARLIMRQIQERQAVIPPCIGQHEANIQPLPTGGAIVRQSQFLFSLIRRAGKNSISLVVASICSDELQGEGRTVS